MGSERTMGRFGCQLCQVQGLASLAVVPDKNAVHRGLAEVGAQWSLWPLIGIFLQMIAEQLLLYIRSELQARWLLFCSLVCLENHRFVRDAGFCNALMP